MFVAVNSKYTLAFLLPAVNVAICLCTRRFFHLSVAIFSSWWNARFVSMNLSCKWVASRYSLCLILPKRVRCTSFMQFPRTGYLPNRCRPNSDTSSSHFLRSATALLILNMVKILKAGVTLGCIKLNDVRFLE